MTFETEAAIARRPVPWPAGALALAFSGLIAHGADQRTQLVAPLVFGAMLLALAFVGGRPAGRRSKTLTKVSADTSGLRVAGELVMDRAAIADAYLVPAAGGGVAVHLEARRLAAAYTVFLPTAEEGRALLDALGHGREESIARFRALPPWIKHLGWLGAFLIASPWLLFSGAHSVPAWGLTALVAFYAVAFLPRLFPQHVEVGHDGVLLKSPGNSRFLPFSTIEGAVATKAAVQLSVRGERALEIRFPPGGAPDAEALVSRIQAGIGALSALSRGVDEATLARRGRDLESWIDAMRTLGSGEERGGYRVAAVPRGRLWEIVENAAADPSAREGAAFALSAVDDDETRSRLSALAKRTAQPGLRVALEIVAGEVGETELARYRVAVEAEAEAEAEESDGDGDGDAESDDSSDPLASRRRR